MDDLLGALQTLMMATATDTKDAKTHLKKLTPFYGDRKLIKKFILYILRNLKDFPTNNSKVIFILSYMNDGEAEKYYIDNEVITAGSYIWPKFADFYTKLIEAFVFEDKKEDSVRKLETLKQSNRNAEELTNEFWLLVTKAGLNKDNQMLIRTYWCALNPQLTNKIMYFTYKPSTLKDTGTGTTCKKGWYSIVAQYDQIHCEAQEAIKEWQLIGSLQYAQKSNTNNNWKPWYNYAPWQQQHDLNAMDINTITMALNAMSYEKWGITGSASTASNLDMFHECPKKWPTNVRNFGAGHPHNNGLFAWGNQGAFTQTNNVFNRKPDAPRKIGPQELNKHICALSQEEREIMFDLAEVEDNDKGPSKKDFSWGEWQGVLLSLPHLVFIALF